MYVTGDSFNFENRLHSATVSADLVSYSAEGISYSSSVDSSWRIKWNREYAKKYHSINGDPQYLAAALTGSGIFG